MSGRDVASDAIAGARERRTSINVVASNQQRWNGTPLAADWLLLVDAIYCLGGAASYLALP